MALFARICVRVHSRVPAPTFPFPPYMWGEMEMGGCAIGRACVRMLVRMRERRERGRGRREGRFYLLQGISQGTALPLSQVSFICCKEYPQAALSYAYAPARLRTHIFPPHIYGGENGHIGACARACVRMRMRMREGGCLSCCGLYTTTPSPQPLPSAPSMGQSVKSSICGAFSLRRCNLSAERGKRGRGRENGQIWVIICVYHKKAVSLQRIKMGHYGKSL